MYRVSRSHNSEFHLPLELLREIIKLLDPAGQRNMMLVAHVVRNQAIEFLFKQLSYSRFSQIQRIHKAREDVKGAIRKLRLSRLTEKADELIILFQFLRTLPNLQSFEYNGFGPSHQMSPFFDSIRHAPLSELIFGTSACPLEDGLPVE
ncbi:hypothetical protein H0H87_001450, partial [Tephrocybe sp. NHM501043]